MFKEIQNAYEILSDKHERAWYDSHRDQIMRSGERHQAGGGGGGGESAGGQKPPEEEELFNFFSNSAFSGYGDGPKVRAWTRERACMHAWLRVHFIAWISRALYGPCAACHWPARGSCGADLLRRVRGAVRAAGQGGGGGVGAARQRGRQRQVRGVEGGGAPHRTAPHRTALFLAVFCMLVHYTVPYSRPGQARRRISRVYMSVVNVCCLQ